MGASAMKPFEKPYERLAVGYPATSRQATCNCPKVRVVKMENKSTQVSPRPRMLTLFDQEWMRNFN